MSHFIKNLLSRNASFNPGVKPRLLSRYESNSIPLNEFNAHEKGDQTENSSNIDPVGKKHIHYYRESGFPADPVIKRAPDIARDLEVEHLNDNHNRNSSKVPQLDREYQTTSPPFNQELLPLSDIKSSSSDQNSEAHESLHQETSFPDEFNTRSNEAPLLKDTIFSQPLFSNQPVNTLSQQDIQDPVIKVSIGQIEVKATFEKKEKPPKRKSTPKPRMSLQDYMDKIKNNG